MLLSCACEGSIPIAAAGCLGTAHACLRPAAGDKECGFVSGLGDGREIAGNPCILLLPCQVLALMTAGEWLCLQRVCITG